MSKKFTNLRKTQLKHIGEAQSFAIQLNICMKFHNIKVTVYFIVKIFKI